MLIHKFDKLIETADAIAVYAEQLPSLIDAVQRATDDKIESLERRIEELEAENEALNSAMGTLRDVL